MNCCQSRTYPAAFGAQVASLIEEMKESKACFDPEVPAEAFHWFIGFCNLNYASEFLPTLKAVLKLQPEA